MMIFLTSDNLINSVECLLIMQVRAGIICGAHVQRQPEAVAEYIVWPCRQATISSAAQASHPSSGPGWFNCWAMDMLAQACKMGGGLRRSLSPHAPYCYCRPCGAEPPRPILLLPTLWCRALSIFRIILLTPHMLCPALPSHLHAPALLQQWLPQDPRDRLTFSRRPKHSSDRSHQDSGGLLPRLSTRKGKECW